MLNKHTHTMVIKSKKTGKILRRFDYPSRNILGKFFWEKIKQEELTKYLKSHDIVADEVIVSEELPTK